MPGLNNGLLYSIGFVALLYCAAPSHAGVTTWDGRHSIEQVEVTAVYFVPKDRTPLPDWRERVDYFCRRIAQFHAREYGGQSTLTTRVHEEPYRSARNTEQLRSGDGDFIFFQTLREVDEGLSFAQGERTAFPILLVLSDVNWRPLDDFYRLRPGDNGLEFEGNYNRGQHFPGAASGGARATYLADRGVGWGLVSADGWRVPYRGSDCVVYHEGVGHTVGLPHPEPGNGSVMSLGQYQGWISESWLDTDQKQRMGWVVPEDEARPTDLFTCFRAIPAPLIPAPGEDAGLDCDWPPEADVESVRVRIQTDVFGPWIEVPQATGDDVPERLTLGNFDRPTPVSYRIDARLDDGQTVELWGYLQVRSSPDVLPLPPQSERTVELAPDLAPAAPDAATADEIDLLPLINVERDAIAGRWRLEDGVLTAPKQYGARIEIPYEPPAEYRLTVIAEPLGKPNGLILGQRSGENRFLVLTGYANGDPPSSAIENVNGQNVDTGPTTVRRKLFQKGRPAQVVCTVRRDSIKVVVDGVELIDWEGDPAALGLSDYWSTPTDNALFIGAYDSSYRITRVGLTPLSGEGRVLTRE